MRNFRLQNTLYILLILFFVGCEENTETEQISNSLIGYWINPQTTDSLITYSKSTDLVENNYGIAFHSDGTLIERKNSGWCATPPISYSDFTGSWTKADSIINISVEYWGGLASYQWKLMELNNEKLVVYKIEEDYKYENDNSMNSSIDTIELKYNECVTTFGQSSVCFDSVLNDSRCPEGGECIWEGNAKIILRVLVNGINENKIELNTNQSLPTDTTINYLNVALINLTPYPDISTSIIPKDYIAKISFANLATIESNAQIISFNPDKEVCSWGWTIKIDNDTIKSYDVLIGETVGYDITEPIDVYIQLGAKERDCSMTGIDYYEIDRIIEVE